MPDTLQFKIHGMDCVEEVNILKRELRDRAGSESNLSFDILNGRMTLRDAGRLSAPQVIEIVARTGMSAELWASAEQSATRSEKRTWWRDARTTMTIDTPARDESEKITVPLATRTLEQETWSIPRWCWRNWS